MKVQQIILISTLSLIYSCGSSQSNFDKAKMFYENEKYDSAITYFTRSLHDVDIDKKVVFHYRGNSLYKLNNYRAAIFDYTMASSLGDRDSEMFVNLGVSYEKVGAYNEAEEAYKKSLLIYERQKYANFNLGVIYYYQKKDYRRAIHYLTKETLVDSSEKETYHLRGQAYYNLNILDSAFVDFDKVTTMAPDFYEGHLFKGRVLADMGKYKDALSSFDLAIENNPDQAIIYADRGILYIALGEKDKACKDYNEAIKRGINKEDLHDLLIKECE